MNSTVIDILTLVATSALAYGAIMIARRANAIAERSVSVEVDKHIFEWGQRCLNCASRISSLRMLPEDKLSDEDFEEERRQLYAELFALKEEGTLFFEKDQKDVSTPCILALQKAVDCVRHDKFSPPKKGDFATRKANNNAMRDHIREFSSGIQTRVGGQWSGN